MVVKLLTLLILIQCRSFSCTTLAEKSALVANSVFRNFITSVVRWQEVEDDVTDFLQLFRGNVVVATVENNTVSNEIIQNLHKNEKIQQTIFFGAEIREVEYFLSLLYQVLIRPIRFIVVLTKPVAYTDLSRLMEISWNNDVADILVLSVSAEKVLLSTYYPYRSGRCGDFTPVQLDYNTKELFPRKFMNFHGCEIRTSLLHLTPFLILKFNNHTLESISGTDGNILNMLLEAFNASMNVFSSEDHGGLGTIVRGRAIGSIADLVRKLADIMVPALIVNSIRYPYLQLTHPHWFADVLWFGPRQRELSDWYRLLQPFVTLKTPALLTTAFVFVLATTLVKRFSHRYYSWISVLFQSFAIFLGIEVKFGTESRLTNYLFMLWVWFCMVVRIVFQGDLVNRLQITAFESPFRTLAAAVDQVDSYGGLDTMRYYLNGTQYYDNYKVIPFQNISLYLEAIEAGKRNLLAVDKVLGLHSAPSAQVLYDDPIIRGSGICFYMRPGWPAVPEINNFMMRIIETGFVDKIYKENFRSLGKTMETKENRDAKPLTSESLIGYFYGLGILYGVCVLVLFAEIAYHKFDKRNLPRVVKVSLVFKNLLYNTQISE